MDLQTKILTQIQGLHFHLGRRISRPARDLDQLLQHQMR